MLMVTWLGGGAIQPALGLAREVQTAERGCGSWRRPGSPGGSPPQCGQVDHRLARALTVLTRTARTRTGQRALTLVAVPDRVASANWVLAGVRGLLAGLVAGVAMFRGIGWA